MRSFVRHGLVLGTCLTAFVATAGCEQKKATEYVTGVTTQVQVPRDLKSVKVQVAKGGFVQFAGNYKVYNGVVLLPRSLGEYASTTDAQRGGPITFTITGLTEDYIPESAGNAVFTQSDFPAQVGQNNVRILRRSTQPYIPDHILFLPMALKYACFDKVCSATETCKGGLCVSADLPEEEARKLPEYTDGMGDGTDGGCFSSSLCMAAAVPAAPVDVVNNCEFVVPETKDAPVLPTDLNPFRQACTTDDQCTPRKCTNGQCELLPPNSPGWNGLNVEVTFDGGQVREVLDLDKDEGYFIPDPAKPQNFRLAPGLCAMFRGDVDAQGKPTTAHRITSVRASATCAPKVPTQVICAADQLKAMGADTSGKAPDVVDSTACKMTVLEPTKSGMVLIVDNTAEHKNFFTSSDPKEAFINSLNLLFRDPIYRSVSAQTLLADSASPATCDSFPALTLKQSLFPGENPQGSLNDGLKLLKDVATNPPTDPARPELKAPMVKAYEALDALDDSYARRAVVVFTNSKDSNAATCGPDAKTPSDLAFDAARKPSKPVTTFAAKLVKSGDASVATAIAGAGTPDALSYLPDPQTDSDKLHISDVITNYVASTCLFDANGDTATDSTLSFANTLTGAPPTNVSYVATCGGNSPGWTLDTTDPTHTRIQLCGDSCAAFQKTSSDMRAYAALYNQPSEPLPVFRANAACGTKK